MKNAKLFLFLLPLLVVGCNKTPGGEPSGGGGGGGETTPTEKEKTFTFAYIGYSDAQALSTLSGYGVTFTFDKGSGNDTPKYYETDESARVYINNTLTISATKITKVEFTFSTGKTGTFTCDKDGYTDTSSSGVWNGEASSLKFTVSAGKQKRIQSVKINFTSSSDDPGDFGDGYTDGWPTIADVEEYLGVEIAIPVLSGYEEKSYWQYYPEDDEYYQSIDIYVDDEDIEDEYIALLTNSTNNYELKDYYYCDPTKTLAIYVAAYALDDGYDWAGTYISAYLYSDLYGTEIEFTDGWPTASDVQEKFGVSFSIPVLSGYENKAYWAYFEEGDEDYQNFAILIDEEDITEQYAALLTNYTQEDYYLFTFYCDSSKTVAILLEYYNSELYVGSYISVYLYNDIFGE